MKVSILLLAITLAVVLADKTMTEAEYQSAFTSWMHSNSKAYDSYEFQYRFDTFKTNVDFVNRWDAAESGFEVELNKFADLNIHEFSRLYLGTKVNAAKLGSRMVGLPEKETAPTLDAVDWRSKGYVTAIKDQGQCGSCWSFSTTGSTEGAWFKKHNALLSLSEQQLVDCSGSFGNQGCDGGLMDDAFRYIIKNGIVSEDSYPYTAKDGTCDLSGKTIVAHLSSYKDVAKTETALTSAIETVGPVSVAIDASHSSFQLYKSGVYYEKQCSSTQLDHGVLAVGYGTSGTDDYYIVKNSWGVNWGIQGYIQMARGQSNNCGIASMASYPIAA